MKDIKRATCSREYYCAPVVQPEAPLKDSPIGGKESKDTTSDFNLGEEITAEALWIRFNLMKKGISDKPTS